MSSSVQNIGGNALAVNDGNSTWLIQDRNTDGKVDDGDVVTQVTQGGARIVNWVVGSGDALESSGDPHLYDLALGAGAEAAATAAADELFQAAKSGNVSDASLGAAADSALNGGATRTYIADYQANATLSDDGVLLKVKVVPVGQVAVADTLDMQVTGADGTVHTVTISNIDSNVHAAGTLTVADTSTNDAARAYTSTDKAGTLIVKREGANVQISTMLFGADAGNNVQPNVALDINGHVNFKRALQNKDTIAFYDRYMVNPAMLSAFDLGESTKKKNAATAGAGAATPAVTTAAGAVVA